MPSSFTGDDFISNTGSNVQKYMRGNKKGLNQVRQITAKADM
jgi:hypothetical protein